MACLASAALVSCGGKTADPALNEGFTSTMAGHLARLDSTTAARRVVFMGSSTLQALDLPAVTPWGMNLAMGGDTLEALTKRAGSYRALKQALAVVLNIGFNDVANGCQAISAAQLSGLLHHVPAQTPLVVVGLQVPSDRVLASRCSGRLSSLLEEANSAWAAACAAQPVRCSFVTHPTAMATSAVRAQMLANDGIHLSTLGYAHLAKALREALPARLRATGD